MNLEKSVKDLQAQNAQFQDLILNLSKGQDELKALLTKKEKRPRRSVGVLNIGRRFRGPLKRAEEVKVSKEDDNEQDDGASVKTDAKSNYDSAKPSKQEEDYYHEDEHPDDKY